MKTLYIKQNGKDASVLTRKDPVMGQLIAIVGDLEIQLRPNLFQSLVRSIIGQQISVAAAGAIYKRLTDLTGQEMTARYINKIPDVKLREIGLSTRKIDYLQDLAVNIIHHEIDLSSLHNLDNDDIIKQLTKIKGIGKWTAEMFLIFSLGRMNVLAIDDIGIQRGARWLYQVDKANRRQILKKMRDIWSPHLTVASFYLWEIVHLDFEKQYHSISAIQ